MAKATCAHWWDKETRCSNVLTDGGDYCQQHCPAGHLEAYRALTEHFRQDVREFWTRSNFFLLGHAALMAGFAAIATSQAGYNRPVGTALGVLGLLLAVTWFRVAASSVWWIDRWRDQVIEMERGLPMPCCFGDREWKDKSLSFREVLKQLRGVKTDGTDEHRRPQPVQEVSLNTGGNAENRSSEADGNAGKRTPEQLEVRAQDVAQYLPLLFSAGWLSLIVLAPIFA